MTATFSWNNFFLLTHNVLRPDGCLPTPLHYNDVIMNTMASPFTSLASVNAIVYASADQRKHQSSASLAFVRGIHRWPVTFPHKRPVTRKKFPFHDVIMRRNPESMAETSFSSAQNHNASWPLIHMICWFITNDHFTCDSFAFSPVCR